MTSPAQTGLQEAWPTEPAGPRPSRRTPLHWFKELPVLLVLALGVALLMKTFLLQMFYIPSESMERTLLGPSCSDCRDGDRIAVNKLVYRVRDPRRGEVVVFIKDPGSKPTSLYGKIKGFLTEGIGVTTPTETDFVKRVVGLPGETVEVRRKAVWITPSGGGRPFPLREPYIELEGGHLSLQEPLKIPAGHYFMMGDNRNHSSDSRVFGPISRTKFIGKAFVKIWPPKRWDVIDSPMYSNAPRAAAAVAVPVAVALALRRRRRWRAR